MNKPDQVLVADDEGEMRSLLGLILRSCGYPNLLYASDGQSALAVLESRPIKIAFVDINMPGADGLSVVKLAKTIAPGCFCVIVSAHSGLQNVKEAVAAGAKAFIVKPYTEQRIVDVLKKYERLAAAVL